MPLMKVRQMPETHAGCDETPCLACLAERHLQPGDWAVVRFYQFVSDQVSNPAPFGLEGGAMWLPLRLSDLVAACDLLGIPAADRFTLVSDARYLNDVLTGREKQPGLHRLPVDALEPPEA